MDNNQFRNTLAAASRQENQAVRLHQEQVSQPKYQPGVMSQPGLHLPPQSQPARKRKETAYGSVPAMVAKLRPSDPVQILRPHAITRAANWFLSNFPGDVMYSVKSNPDPRVISTLLRAGLKHFDAASIPEIELVSQLAPQAQIYYMHPVKSRESIATAYFGYGVRDFSLDSHEELQKILSVTNHAQDLNLHVRLGIPNEKAFWSLQGKFGVPLEEASSLIQATRKAANKLGICFHVGSQCMDEVAFTNAVDMVHSLLVQTGVRLDALDVGGGFPSVYPNMTPPDLKRYTDAIGKAFATLPVEDDCRLMCEPGRAMVAEGGAVLVRVELRKGAMLYINDGTYGSLFDAGYPAMRYPVRAIRPNGTFSRKSMEFGFFGPTCDTLDTMKGPFNLPSDIREGDWIEIGQLGAYGAAMRTKFNGFYSDHTVEVADAPLLTMYDSQQS